MNLFIDTHLNDVIIILHKDNEIVKIKKLENQRENSKIIMTLIKEVLNEKKPESIIVVNGPGSFTGVRLGVTIAKTLAYTLNIPIRTITSLECMALSTTDKIVAFSDKNGYYIGIFDEEHKLVGNYEYLSNKEYEEYTKKYKVVNDIELDYLKIIEFALQKKEINPHKVNPIYVKKLDVEKWLEMQLKKMLKI